MKFNIQPYFTEVGAEISEIDILKPDPIKSKPSAWIPLKANEKICVFVIRMTKLDLMCYL